MISLFVTNAGVRYGVLPVRLGFLLAILLKLTTEELSAERCTEGRICLGDIGSRLPPDKFGLVRGGRGTLESWGRVFPLSAMSFRVFSTVAAPI